MYIQEPVTVLTDLLLVVLGLYLFVKILRKQDYRPAAVFYLLFFAFASAMASCGVFYHINKKSFLLVQHYGTMFFGGLVGGSISLAAIFDNYKNKTAFVFTLLTVIILAIYYYVCFFVITQSFLPFILIQLIGVIIMMLSFLRQAGTSKAKYIFAAGGISIIAGMVEIPSISFLIFNENDFFHLLSMIAIYFIYKAAIMHEDVRV